MAETTSGDAGASSSLDDGSLANVQLAQGAEPIGEIREIAGNVGLHRADGSPIVAEIGTPIFQDDRVVTGSDATVEIVFIDGMTFSLGANGSVTIDTLIYNPGGDGNAIDLDVARGAFVFITGQVAPASGEGINVETPAGVIGVRGTSGACDDSALAALWTCAILPDPVTNHVGRITLTNRYGVQILDTAFESTQASPTTAPTETEILTPAQATELFGDPLSLLQEQFPELAPPNRGRDGEPDDPDASGLNEINPAADGDATGDGPVEFAQMVPPAESLDGIYSSDTLGELMGSSESEQVGGDTARLSASGALANSESDAGPPESNPASAIEAPPDSFLPVETEASPVFSPTPDSNVVSEDDPSGPATGNVLANDGSQGAARQVVEVAGSAANVGQPVQGEFGVLTLNADGTYSYVLDNDDPDVQALGEGETALESVSYVASNGTTSKAATLTITVSGTNDQPEAVDDGGFSVPRNGSLLFSPASLTGNDQDIDGDTLVISSISDPANGSAVLNGDGSVTYTPDPGYSGPDSFSYTISDGHGGTSTGTVSLEVAGNKAPTDIALSNATVDENAAGAVIGTVTVNDPDAGETHTLTVSDSRFEVVGDELRLKAGQTLDFETAPTVSVDITAKDSGGLSLTETFVIQVTDVNEAPVITSNGGEPAAAITVAENSKAVTTVTAVDPDAGQTLTFSIVGGADASLFAIDSATGALSFVNAPDFEAPADQGADNAYDVIVQASDGTLTDTQAIAVTVADAVENSAPIALDDSFTTKEDTKLSGSVAGNDSDADGDTLAYSLVGDLVPGLTFNPDGSFDYSPPADSNGEVTFQYQVDDGKGGTDTATVTIDVTPVNDPPVALDDSFTTKEDTKLSGSVAGNDSDADGDTLAYSLVGDLVPGLTFNPDGSFDYSPPANSNGEVTFQYQVDDGKGGTDTATVTIDVTPVNDPPVALDDSFTTKEDTKLSGSVAENDSDVDGDTLAYSLVGDPVPGLAFNPDGSFDYSPPANSNGEVTFKYQVDDGKGGTDTATVTIDVTPVNNPPTVPVDGDDAANTVAEGAAAGTVVGLTAFSTDPDLGDTVTYSLTDDAGGRFQIDAETGVVSVKNGTLLDFETADSHQIDVQASDGTLTSSQTFTIGVTDVVENAAPVITSNGGEPTASITVAENSKVVTTVTAVDPDAGQTLMFSIVGGGDASLFAIDSVTGALSFVSAPDFEAPADQGADNVYDVIVEASDGVLTDTQAIAVTVADVVENSAPIAGDDSFTTKEDTKLSGSVAGNDSDVDGDTLAYSLVGDPVPGLTLNPDGSFDYSPPADSNGEVTFQYQVDDGKDGTDTATVTIDVTPVDDPPTVPVDDDDAANTVAENATTGTAVGITALSTDPDLGDSVTYSLTDDAGGRFQIDAETGVVSVKNGALLDFETADSHQIDVQASDGALTSSQTFTIGVTDVAENAAPVITSNGGEPTATIAVAENSKAVTTVTAVDPDAGQTLTFSIAGGADANLFAIDSVTGALSFVNAPDFEAPADQGADNAYDVIVQASDGALTDTQAIAVSVTDVNDTPTAVGDSNSVSEGQQAADNGAAMKTTVTVAAGAVLTLQFNFLDSEPPPDEEFFKDFAVIVIDGQVIKLADVDAAANPIGVSDFAFNEQSGYATFTFTFTAAGTYDIGLAVLNEGDTLFDAGLLVDEVSISDGAFSSGFESGLEGWTTIGNVGAQGVVADVRPPGGEQQALLISNGAQTAAIETFLGLAPGTLSTVANQPVAIGNVLENDDFGPDGPGGVVGIVYEGNPNDVVDPKGTTVGNTTTIMAADGSWQLNIDLATGDYSFTVLSPIAHPGDGADTLSFAFTYMIADANGDTSSAALTIDVIDGVPVAFTDPQQTATEGGGNISGNVLVNDELSPDGVAVTQIAFAGSVDSIAVPATGSLSVTTPLGGTLTVSADGNWSYTPPPALPGTDAAEDGFTYVMTDGDGDQSSASQSILVQQNVDQPPVINSDGGGDMAEVAVAANTTAATAVDPDAYDAIVQSSNGVLTGQSFSDGGSGLDFIGFLSAQEAIIIDPSILGPQSIGASKGTGVYAGDGTAFDDSISGSGADNFLFGNGGNGTHLGADGSDTAFGCEGDNLLSVLTTPDRGLIESIITTIGRIDLTGSSDNFLALDALDVIAISDTNALLVMGNSGDSVSAIGQGWTKNGAEVVEGHTCDRFLTAAAGGAATLLIDTDISTTIN